MATLAAFTVFAATPRVDSVRVERLPLYLSLSTCSSQALSWMCKNRAEQPVKKRPKLVAAEVTRWIFKTCAEGSVPLI